MDFGIDGRRRFHNLFDPRIRAADHEHHPVRRVDGKRQFLEFPGSRGLGHERDERDFGNFGRFVDGFEVGTLPKRPRIS